MLDTELDYWRGLTDGRLAGIETAINEVKNGVKSIENKVDALRLWKAKVAGVAIAASAAVTFVFKIWEAAK